jgi:hypothetical protein
MNDRPFGPSNALCSWFARFAHSRPVLPVAVVDAAGARDGALTGRTLSHR